MPATVVTGASKDTARQIWNAIKMMLPRHDEDAVLRILMNYVSDRLVLGPENSPQHSGGSSPSKSVTAPVSGASADDLQESHARSIYIIPARREGPNVMLPRVPLAENTPKQGTKQPSVAKQRKRPNSRRRPRASTWTVSTKAHSPTILTGGILGQPIPRAPSHRHTCPQCPQTLSQRLAMEVHVKCHGSAGRHKCTGCDYATDSKHSFNWHIKAHVQPAPQPAEEPMDGGDVDVVVDSAVDNRVELPIE